MIENKEAHLLASSVAIHKEIVARILMCFRETSRFAKEI